MEQSSTWASVFPPCVPASYPRVCEVTYHTENGALGFGRVVTEEDMAK